MRVNGLTILRLGLRIVLFAGLVALLFDLHSMIKRETLLSQGNSATQLAHPSWMYKPLPSPQDVPGMFQALQNNGTIFITVFDRFFLGSVPSITFFSLFALAKKYLGQSFWKICSTHCGPLQAFGTPL